MVLQPPVLTRIRIRSPTRFFASTEQDATYLDWKCISTDTPVKSLVLYSRQPVQLKPDYTLGATFVRYWDALPEELRVNIIAENMMAYPHRQALRHSPERFIKLYPHCRMTPQIARMATEAYYKNNEFLIQLTTGMPNRYPPAPFNDLIRRLYLTMYIFRSQWTFLRKLSLGMLGFGNLKYIEILISWHYPSKDVDGTEWDNFVDDTLNDPIVFSCEGKVALATRPAGLKMRGPRHMRADPAQEAAIQSRIRFGVK
jgi:hypothetical protein